VVDPFEKKGPLPAAVNLDVPFTSQSPYAKWTLQDEESCEEASVIMVDGFYAGRTGIFSPNEATKKINAVVAYEMKTFGFYEDTTAAQTAQILNGLFKYQNVIVRPLTSVDDLKRALANGFPVILPAAGKLLGNPNFSNGGPLYHMLVVKGYTKDRFITNDPGTRKGRDYTYSYQTIMNAAHDWNDGDVINGSPVMLVALPNR